MLSDILFQIVSHVVLEVSVVCVSCHARLVLAKQGSLEVHVSRESRFQLHLRSYFSTYSVIRLRVEPMRHMPDVVFS